MTISEIVRDPEWQALRISMIGTWMSQSRENVDRLNRYLGDGKDPLKVRRVLNYITGSGFRSGKISSRLITQFREYVRYLHRRQ